MKHLIKSIFQSIGTYFKSLSFKIQLFFYTRSAIMDCNGDRKKRWLVRGKHTYVTFTEGIVKYNKNIQTLNNDVNAMKMDETADRIIIYDSRLEKARIFGKNEH